MSRPKSTGLTERELEVLALVVEGNQNKEIARILHIEVRTVKHQLTSVFRKLGVADRTQAAIWFVRHLEANNE